MKSKDLLFKLYTANAGSTSSPAERRVLSLSNLKERAARASNLHHHLLNSDITDSAKADRMRVALLAEGVSEAERSNPLVSRCARLALQG